MGLKLSIHQPRPPELPLVHGHWSSDKLGIHEDVDASLFSPHYWTEYANEFLESINYFEPSSDEDIIVLSDFFSDALKDEFLPKKERMMIDVGQVVRGIFQKPFYRTKVRKLLPLVRDIRKNSSVGSPNIVAMSDNSIMIPIGEEEVIAFESHKLIDKLVKSNFNSLFNPMQRALSRIDSSYFNKWIPSFDTSFLNGIIDNFNYSDFRIVDF